MKISLLDIFQRYLIFLVMPLMIFLVYLSYTGYVNKNSELELLNSDLQSDQYKIDQLKNNQKIVGDKVDKYNLLLMRLIPDREDYFSIIRALDKISQSSGFIISQYSINPQDTSTDHTCVQVEGNGDSDAFYKFLEDYRYGGDRLMTNGAIEFVSGKFKSSKLDLCFYIREKAKTTKSTNISQTDIELLDKISTKLSINLNEDNSSIEIKPKEYSTKENLF
ncbi:MAG: hypothetical protein WCO06_03770 [Candidatus Roizmanbacteria bacterium]